jgi:hypothetical protein
MFTNICEISSSHGGEYEVQNCLLRCTAVHPRRQVWTFTNIVRTKMRGFWDIALCSLVGPVDGGSTHLWNVKSTPSRRHGTTSQKTLFFILAAVWTWSLTVSTVPTAGKGKSLLLLPFIVRVCAVGTLYFHIIRCVEFEHSVFCWRT